MGWMQYKLPQELHRQLKVAAAESGLTLRDYVLKVLGNSVKKK
jgi:predicted HicB family RNase H-like nuclease